MVLSQAHLNIHYST